MPGLTPADKQYMTAMDGIHAASKKVVDTYLAVSPAQRNAVLSEMARKSITDHAAESAKMAAMSKPGKGM